MFGRADNDGFDVLIVQKLPVIVVQLRWLTLRLDYVLFAPVQLALIAPRNCRRDALISIHSPFLV
jgi:hypothetical protein